MNTDQLIDMLSTNVKPVKSQQVSKNLLWAAVIGGTASFCLMLATVGLRTGGSGVSTGAIHVRFLALKLVFMLSVAGIGTALLMKLVRPGQKGQKLFLVIFLPFLAVGFAGIVGLALEPSASWRQMVFGVQMVTCLFCIPLFATVPFAALIWALRKGAPTNLTHTGAIAGLVAGALGASAYAFYCCDDSLPFIAVWYGGMVALCAWIGARLGPRLLRW